MTGYRSRYFRHDCAEKGCYYDQLPAWDDFIDECFPRGIRPTDVDGMVEINGHVLFLEEKGPGAGPHEGQRIALRKLSSRDGITTVFFRPTSQGCTDELEVLIFAQVTPVGWQRQTREEFKQWLRDWCTYAQSNPMPQPRKQDEGVA